MALKMLNLYINLTFILFLLWYFHLHSPLMAQAQRLVPSCLVFEPVKIVKFYKQSLSQCFVTLLMLNATRQSFQIVLKRSKGIVTNNSNGRLYFGGHNIRP